MPPFTGIDDTTDTTGRRCRAARAPSLRTVRRMTITTPTVDPASRSAASWSATLASLKSHGIPDDDPRMVAAREGLAFHRVARSIAAEEGQLSRAGVDRLIAALHGAGVPA